MYIDLNSPISSLNDISFKKIKSLKELNHIINIYTGECCDVIYEAERAMRPDQELEEVSYKEILTLLDCMINCKKSDHNLLLSIKDLSEYVLKYPDKFEKITLGLRYYGTEEVLKKLGEDTVKEFSKRYPDIAYKIYARLDPYEAAEYIGKHLPREYMKKYIEETHPRMAKIKKYLFDKKLAVVYFIYVSSHKYFEDYKNIMKYHDIEELYELAKPYMNPEEIEFVEFFKKIDGFEKLKNEEVD